MIQTHAITKRFDRLQILKGIDIEVHDREIVAIVGPSGAGKTTLLQIVGTLDRPDSGHVIIDGVDPFTLSERRMAAFRNQHIGFVFQFHRLLPEFTALENVMIPALIARDSAAEAERKARELLDFLHLSDRITHKPAELSGGEKQRVAVARALINRPAQQGRASPSLLRSPSRPGPDLRHRHPRRSPRLPSRPHDTNEGWRHYRLTPPLVTIKNTGRSRRSALLPGLIFDPA